MFRGKGKEGNRQGDDRIVCGLQAAKGADEAKVAAAEHLEELAVRIQLRRRWLDDESDAIQKKIAHAQQPVMAEREERAQARDGVADRVAALRSGSCYKSWGWI